MKYKRVITFIIVLCIASFFSINVFAESGSFKVDRPYVANNGDCQCILSAEKSNGFTVLYANPSTQDIKWTDDGIKTTADKELFFYNINNNETYRSISTYFKQIKQNPAIAFQYNIIDKIPLTANNISLVIPCTYSYYMSVNTDKIYQNFDYEEVSIQLMIYDSDNMLVTRIPASNYNYYSGYGILVTFDISSLANILNYGFISVRLSTSNDLSIDYSSDSLSDSTIYDIKVGIECSSYNTVYYSYSDNFDGTLIELIKELDNKLGKLNNTVGDLAEGIARLQISLDTLNGQIDVTNNTLAELVDNQKQTNDYLKNDLKDDLKESISTSIEQAAENEKNEAMDAGEQAVANVQNAINDVVPLDQYKDALDDFSQSFVSSSTVSVWQFPELYIPAIPALGNKKIPLSVSVDINLSQAYLQYVPETIRIIIGNVLGAALTYYLIKEVMSLTTYMLDNKGGGDVDE